jgi:hypothetical protein
VELKRFFLSTVATLCLVFGAVADVAIKDLGGGAVEITFTYKDDASSEMGVIGSFDNWTVPGEAMAKNAAGLWEFKLKALSTDELQYKFYSKGTWIFDFKAPDKKDDGFGGNNGLIVVADVLAGTGSKASGAVAASGPVRKKVSFGTISWLESASSFSSAGKTFTPTASAINARSTLMFYGDMVPNMPGRFELTYFNGTFPVYTPSTLDAMTGLQNLGAALIFNPFYQLGGNVKPVIDKFVFGATSPGLVFETGMGNVYVPTHSSVLWQTVQSYLISGAGYSVIALGPDFQKGDISVEAALMPNRIIGGKYGLYSYLNAGNETWKAELQYEMRSFTATDTANLLSSIPRQDLILGGQYFLDQLSFKGQLLDSMFAAGGSADSLAPTEKIAAELALGYTDFFEMYNVTFDYRYRGSIAQTLFADDPTILGAAGTQSVGANGYVKLGHWVTGNLAATAMLQNAALSTGNVALTIIPGTLLDFSIPARRPLTADIYGVGTFDTKPATGASAFNFAKVAAKVEVGDLPGGIINTLDVWYGLDKGSSMLNSLILQAKMNNGFTAQAGGGLRSGTAVASPFGAAFGASWSVPAPQARNPLLYVQGCWNFDPWDPVAKGSLDWNDSWRFLPDGGITKSDGSSALRLGLSWSF